MAKRETLSLYPNEPPTPFVITPLGIADSLGGVAFSLATDKIYDLALSIQLRRKVG